MIPTQLFHERFVETYVFELTYWSRIDWGAKGIVLRRARGLFAQAGLLYMIGQT